MSEPIPMLLWCPTCSSRHIDVDEFATKPHHTHACQNCGMCWRPAIVPTVGVRFLPGFKNEQQHALVRATCPECRNDRGHSHGCSYAPELS